MIAPRTLWREGPPFSLRQAVGAFVCVVQGHHDPVVAREVWNPEHRDWAPVSDTAHAGVCRRCGRTTAPRFEHIRFR